MGIIQKFIEKRTEKAIDGMTMEELLLRAGYSSDRIDETKAMQIPALASGVNLIAETVAMLPIKLYKKKDKVLEVDEIEDDYRLRLLNQDTGDTMTAYEMKRAMVRDYLLHGHCNTYINREGNNIKSLHYVKANETTVLGNVDVIFKDYNILVQGKNYAPYDFVRMLRHTNDGIRGIGILDESSEILAVNYNMIRQENRQTKNGGAKGGFLQSENRIDQGVIDDLKKSWRNMYADDSDEKIVILNSGLTFKEATATAVELQLDERKRTNSDEISKLLHIPVSLLLGAANEEVYITAIKTAVAPFLEAFAIALNRDMLLESEKDRYFFAVDDNDLLKGDTLKRYQAYAMGIKNGFLQIDDVRYKENMESLDLDFIKLGLQDVLYDTKTKTITTPNTGITQKLAERNPKITEKQPDTD